VSYLKAQLALDKNTVMVGEPIIVRYALVNDSDRTFIADLGEDQQGWLVVSVFDRAKQPIQRLPSPPQQDTMKLSSPPDKEVRPGASFTGGRSLGQTYRLSRAGAYWVRVSGSIPFRFAPGVSAPGEAQTRRQILASTRECRFDRWLPLEVTKPDAAHLRRIALGYANRIRTNGSVADTQLAVSALFSMPPEIASPFWVQLAKTNPLDVVIRYQIIAELERNTSKESTDVLTAIWDDPMQPREFRSRAKADLFDLWTRGTPAVKRHIETVVSSRGATLPKATHPFIVPYIEESQASNDDSKDWVGVRIALSQRGYTISWDATAQRLEATRLGMTIVLVSKDPKAVINGRAVQVGNAPHISGTQLVVPRTFIDALSEAESAAGR
jgi:hypothetical protein